MGILEMARCTIRLDEHGSKWRWRVTDALGGEVGSGHCEIKSMAREKAVSHITAFDKFDLVTDGNCEGTFMKLLSEQIIPVD